MLGNKSVSGIEPLATTAPGLPLASSAVRVILIMAEVLPSFVTSARRRYQEFAESVGRLAAPLRPQGDVPREAMLEALHGKLGLRLEGGRGHNDGGIAMAENGHEVLVEGGEGLVLAALPREFPDEGMAEAREDGVDDGVGGLDLIGPQLNEAEVGGEGVKLGDNGFGLGEEVHWES